MYLRRGPQFEALQRLGGVGAAESACRPKSRVLQLPPVTPMSVLAVSRQCVQSVGNEYVVSCFLSLGGD